MTKNDIKFIDFVKRECKTHGIKCDLRPTKYIRLYGKMKVSGYFGEEEKVLACSMNREDSLGILAHEYAHMTQWIDKEPLFMEVSPSIIKIDDWLLGKNVKDIEKHLSTARDMELDNEKRTVKIIKKHGLSIDVKKYIKGANAYIHLYNYLNISRKWPEPSNSPYNNVEILEYMPYKFNMNYNKMSPKLIKLYSKNNI